MSFASPAFVIAGLCAVAIPILIHLLWRQQRRPVEWAAMRFLLEAWRRHRRRLRIEQMLLLALRCGLLIALGAALAKPRLSGNLGPFAGSSRTMYVVVDDGLLSGVQNDAGVSALDRHIETALSLIDDLRPGDRVGVVSASQPARALLLPPTTDIGAARTVLRNMTSEYSATDFAGAIRVLNEQLGDHSDDGSAVVLMLSEFRSGSARLAEPLIEFGGLRDRLVILAPTPAESLAPNVSIVAVEPVRSVILARSMDGSDIVTIRLRRSGGDLERQTVTVRLSGDGVRSMTPRPVTFAAGQVEATVDFVLDFTAHENRELVLHAKIDADALDADNERFAVLTLRRSIRGLLLDRRTFGLDPTLDRLGAGRWVSRALEPVREPIAASASIELIETEPGTITTADLQSMDFVVIVRPDLVQEDGWRLLRTYLERGGLVLCMPPSESPIHYWTDSLRTHLNLPWQFDREVRESVGTSIDADVPGSALMRMIAADLPHLVQAVEVNRHLPVQATAQDAEVILRMTGGEPLVLSRLIHGSDSASESGMFLYIAAALQLDWTNLPARPLMVPLMQELVRQGVSEVRSRFTYIAGQTPILPSAAIIEFPSGETVPLDSQRRPVNRLSSSGIYVLRDSAQLPLRSLAVNIDPEAAVADPQSADQVRAWIERAGPVRMFDADEVQILADLRDSQTTSPIAAAILIAMACLLIAETLFARRVSRAHSAHSVHGVTGIRPTVMEGS